VLMCLELWAFFLVCSGFRVDRVLRVFCVGLFCCSLVCNSIFIALSTLGLVFQGCGLFIFVEQSFGQEALV